MRASVRPVILLGIVLSFSLAAHAQSGVGVEIDDITDNRFSVSENPEELQMRGGLELRLKLKGTNLDRAAASRIVVKEARDDRGTLLSEGLKAPDFTSSEYQAAGLNCSVKSPARDATSVKLKGTVELFVPGRDPNATVNIEKALSKLDKPYSSPKLKTLKLQLTPLSIANYKKMVEDRKLTPEKKEELRKRAKDEGIPEKEFELMMGLAEAFSQIDGPVPDNAVILSGKDKDFDRIFRVEILGADGKPVSVPARGTSSFGEDAIMRLEPKDPLPPNPTLQVLVLTDKSRVSFPFELNVPLP